MRRLTLSDIADVRAYEREREEFRAHIIAMKAKRRIQLGPIMALTFENTETMRFQIQEMARVERLTTDEALNAELAVYNELIPGENELVATLFLELTDKAALVEWLPKLVGIQRQISLVLPNGQEVFGDPLDEERLTREEVTAAVHYLRFKFTLVQVEAFRRGPVSLASRHQSYEVESVLSSDQHRALAADFDD